MSDWGAILLGRRARVGALALLALAVLAAPFALQVRVDNRLERWVDLHSGAARIYERFRAGFGSDEFVIGAYTGKDLFDTGALEEQIAVLDGLEAAPHVVRVSGIPAVFRDQFGGENPDALRNEFLSTPFYRNLLISGDGRVGGLLIETAAPETADGRRELMRGVEAAFAVMRDAGWEVHLAGPPQLNVVLDELSAREAQRVFPLAALCAVVALLLLFRSIRATLVAVSCAVLSLLLTMGLMGLTGRPMTMVTSAMPSLLWVLVLSNIIHILRRYQRHRLEETPTEALRRALHETAPACVLAAVTTAFGFGSLLVADMTPVRELGAFAAAGLLLSLAVNLLVGPLLIRWFRVPAPRRAASVTPAWPSGILRFTRQRAGAVLLVSAVILVAALVCATRVRVESDPLAFLPPDSPVVRDYRFVGERLSGFYTLELLIDTPGGWLRPEVWQALDDVANALAPMPAVARVTSPADLLRKLNHWNNDFDPAAYALPENAGAAHALLADLDGNGRAALRGLATDSGGVVRLSVLVRVMGSREFHDMVRVAEEALRGLPAPMHGQTTGIVLQLVNAQLNLVYTQLESLGIAFLIVFGCIWAGLRSWRLTLVAIPPNLLPILSAFTIMAFAGIALDAATVMMASIALGIAVDDTVHMLSAYRELRRAGRTSADSIETGFRHVAPSMLMTTVVACIGFFALCVSAFVPIQYFGGLSGAAMIAALAADLFMVPATLFFFGGGE